ncbi:MAG: hypothetical protein ACI9U2_001583 [Bradymonadia bacterium]|jgi:hypothetical protein
MSTEQNDKTLDALEDEFDDGWEPPPPPRGVTMRNPILLVAVLAGSIFMFVKYLPRVTYMFDARTPGECGKIHERPEARKAGEALPPLTHDSYCTAQGLVQNFTILATGEPKANTDPAKRNEGRKYYVKLDGDKVFVVLAADRPDVIKYRARRGSLLGFNINEAGRMIDPDADTLYNETGRRLRLEFSTPATETIRIFDTTDDPSARWPALVACIFLLLTALLALFGLIRTLRLLLAKSEDDADDAAPSAG